MKKNLALNILIGFLSFGSKAQTLDSGLWKTQTSFKLNGISLPAKEHEDCVSAEEAKDVKSTIVKALEKESCELTQWEVKKGKLKASLSCQNKDVDAKGKIHGQVSSKSYSLEGEAEGTYKKVIPSTVTVKISGQWIKKCEKEKTEKKD